MDVKQTWSLTRPCPGSQSYWCLNNTNVAVLPVPHPGLDLDPDPALVLEDWLQGSGGSTTRRTLRPWSWSWNWSWT